MGKNSEYSESRGPKTKVLIFYPQDNDYNFQIIVRDIPGCDVLEDCREGDIINLDKILE